MRLEGRYCPDLIRAHQSAVTHHISGQNCRKPALHGLILSSVNSCNLPAISRRHKPDALYGTPLFSARGPVVGARCRLYPRLPSFSGRIGVARRLSNDWLTSAQGQLRKTSMPAYVFRCSPNNGHSCERQLCAKSCPWRARNSTSALLPKADEVDGSRSRHLGAKCEGHQAFTS